MLAKAAVAARNSKPPVIVEADASLELKILRSIYLSLKSDADGTWGSVNTPRARVNGIKRFTPKHASGYSNRAALSARYRCSGRLAVIRDAFRYAARAASTSP